MRSLGYNSLGGDNYVPLEHWDITEFNVRLTLEELYPTGKLGYN
jgi:hypothetical protein